MAEIDREFLAKSHVLATFTGITERPSMAMIHPPLPPQRFANFTIHEYIEYEKPGQYGDEQSDSHGVELGKEQTEEVIAAIEALQPGELVELAWQHDYVTRSDDGGQSTMKSPERPVYILERAPKLLLTVAQGEQGQDGSVPITLITMAGEEAANFAFDGVPQLADVRQAASEALQLHPLQLDFVDMNGAVLEDAPVPEDANAVPAEMPGINDSAAPQPQLRASAAPEISPAAGPQAMDAPNTSTTTQLQPATFSAPQPQACQLQPATFSAPQPQACQMQPATFSAPQPQACQVQPATFSAPQPQACQMATFATSPSTSVMALQPQASPVAMAATRVAPQTVAMPAPSPAMFGMTPQPQPQMRQMSMAAPVTSTVAPQPLAQSLNFVSPGRQAYSVTMPSQIQGACSMAPQFCSAPAPSTSSGMFPQQQAYQIAAAPASYVAPVMPCAQPQACPAATQAAAVPAGLQQRAPQQQPVVMAAAPTPYTNSMTPPLQPCQMPAGSPGMIPIYQYAAPQTQQPIYAAPQFNR